MEMSEVDGSTEDFTEPNPISTWNVFQHIFLNFPYARLRAYWYDVAFGVPGSRILCYAKQEYFAGPAFLH